MSEKYSIGFNRYVRNAGVALAGVAVVSSGAVVGYTFDQAGRADRALQTLAGTPSILEQDTPYVTAKEYGVDIKSGFVVPRVNSVDRGKLYEKFSSLYPESVDSGDRGQVAFAEWLKEEGLDSMPNTRWMPISDKGKMAAWCLASTLNGTHKRGDEEFQEIASVIHSYYTEGVDSGVTASSLTKQCFDYMANSIAERTVK